VYVNIVSLLTYLLTYLLQKLPTMTETSTIVERVQRCRHLHYRPCTLHATQAEGEKRMAYVMEILEFALH